MWKYLSIICCVIYLARCESSSSTLNKENSETLKEQKNSSLDTIVRNVYNGFLRIKTDEMSLEDTLRILNIDKLIYGLITMNAGDDAPVFTGDSDFIIKAYYPDYYIVIAEANDINEENYYSINVAGQRKYLSAQQKHLLFESSKEHVQGSFLNTSSINPLRHDPSVFFFRKRKH